MSTIKAMLRTKYFYVSTLIFVFTYIMNGLVFNGAIYYSRDVLGSMDYYGILALTVVALSIVGIMIAPPIVKKYGKRVTMVVSSIFGVAGHVVILMNPYSLTVVIIGAILRSIGYGMISTVMFTLAADIVEHLEQKTGNRLEGLSTAASSVGVKVGTGLASAILGWTLEFGGYDGSALVQSASVQQAEIIGVFGIPVICQIILIVLALMWDYDKKKVSAAQ